MTIGEKFLGNKAWQKMKVRWAGLGQDVGKTSGDLVKMLLVPERSVTIEWWGNCHDSCRPGPAEGVEFLSKDVKDVVDGRRDGATIFRSEEQLSDGGKDANA